MTATRREQSLSDVPLAVSAIAGQALERANVSSFQELVRVDPSLAIQNYGAAINQFIVRGIESDTAATTGLYFDEVPLVGGSPTEGGGDGSPSMRLLDLERVEVLKGPQGTLFGSGSMAGTLRFITNKPVLGQTSGAFSAALAGVKGGNRLWQGHAVANLPVGETLAVRLVGWNEDGGGYIEQDFGGAIKRNVNDISTVGGRVSAKWQPTSDFTLLASASHQEIKVDGTQNWDLGRTYVSTAYSTEPYKDNLDLFSLTANYDLGFGTVTAATSYSEFSFFRPKDSTPTGQFFGLPGVARYAQTQDFRAYTGELRFASDFDGPVQIVTGAYYQNDQNRFEGAAVQADPVTGETPCNTYYGCIASGDVSALEYSNNLRRRVSQYAIYGQADWEIVPNLTATAGLRYFSATVKDFGQNLQDISDWFGGVLTTPYITQDDRQKESKTSYNFALRYEFGPETSLYGRVASGYRVGGTNNAQNAATTFGIDIPFGYGSDSLWNYEVGFKTALLNRALFLDVAAYRIDWSDQQLPATDPSGAFGYVINAGKTRINGAEIQLRGRPARGLNFAIGAVYTDAKLAADLPQAVLDAGVIGLDGDRVPRVPKLSLNASGEYEAPVTADLDGYVSGAVTYRGASPYTFQSDPTNIAMPRYALLSARIGLRKGDYDLSLYGENLTNKAAVSGLYSALDGDKVYSPRPRTIGVRLTGKF